MLVARNHPNLVQQIHNDVVEDLKNRLASSRAFAFFPNVVTRDRRVPPSLLVLLAFRLTIADEKSDWGINEKALSNHPIVQKNTGLGKNNIRKALALAQLPELACLRRWQKPQRPDGTFGNAADRLNLPPCGASGKEGRHIKREWFDGTLSLNAMAAFLFIRAGTGNGPMIFASEVADRFDWSRPTASKYLRELEGYGLIERALSRHPSGNGKFFGIQYACPPADHWSIWCRGKKPGNGLPCSRKTGDTRNNPPHGNEETSQRISYAPQSRGALYAGDIDFRPLEPLDPASDVDQAWNSENLLGGIDSGIELSVDLWEVEEDILDAIIDTMTDDELRDQLLRATGNRVSSEIVSDAGLFAVRWLAGLRATAVEGNSGQKVTPANALAFILQAISDRIGARPPARLNSLAIIGKRLLGDSYHYSASRLYAKIE